MAFKQICSFVFMGIILTIASCKKDSNDTSLKSSYFAKVNGNTFTADSTRAFLEVDSSFNQRIFIIEAFHDNKKISLYYKDSSVSTTLNITSLKNWQPDYLQFMLLNAANVSIFIEPKFTLDKLDDSAKMVSESSSAQMEELSSSDTLTISDIKFQNIPYEVITKH